MFTANTYPDTPSSWSLSTIAAILLNNQPPASFGHGFRVRADNVHPGDRLICNVNARRVPTASDCLTAIKMFPGLQYPTGPFISRQGTPAPDPNRPISLELDKRKYALPATFRSGNCFVSVGMERQTPTPLVGLALVPHLATSCTSRSGH